MLVLLHCGFSEDSRKIQNAYYLVLTTYVIPYLIRWYKFQHAISLKIKYLRHMRLILCIWYRWPTLGGTRGVRTCHHHHHLLPWSSWWWCKRSYCSSWLRICRTMEMKMHLHMLGTREENLKGRDGGLEGGWIVLSKTYYAGSPKQMRN